MNNDDDSPMRKALSELFDSIEARHDAEPDDRFDADQVLPDAMWTMHVRRGDLSLLVGQPAVGKSLLLANLVTLVAIWNRLPVVYVALEHPALVTTMRLLAAQSGLNLQRLASGRLHHNDWPALSKAMGAFSEAPLKMLTGPRTATADVVRTIEQYEAQLVVIDSFGLLADLDDPNQDRRHELVGRTVRELKRLAIARHMAVAASARVTRSQTGYVQLDQVAESYLLAAEADVVLALSRDPDPDNAVDHGLQVLKDRRHHPLQYWPLTRQPYSAQFQDGRDRPGPASRAAAYTPPS